MAVATVHEQLEEIGRPGPQKQDDGRMAFERVYLVKGDAARAANIESKVFIELDSTDAEFTSAILYDQRLQKRGSEPTSITTVLVRSFIDQAPSTPRAIYGRARLLYPFHKDGDLTTREIHQDYIVHTASYTPPARAALYVGSPTPPAKPDALLVPQPVGNFYCLGDFNPRSAPGNATVFTRVWSNIPAARSVPYGTYPFRFPGLPAGTAGSPTAITAMTPTRGNVSVVAAPTFTASGHPFNVGDIIRVVVNYATGTAGGIVRVTAKTSTTFTTTGFLLYIGADGALDFGNFASGTATMNAPGRLPKVRPGSAVVAYSYALPGVTPGVATDSNFRADPLFEPIVDSTQEETDFLGPGTTPTDSAYRALVASGGTITAVSGVSPYRGSAILERKSILVVAQ